MVSGSAGSRRCNNAIHSFSFEMLNLSVPPPPLHALCVQNRCDAYRGKCASFQQALLSGLSTVPLTKTAACLNANGLRFCLDTRSTRVCFAHGNWQLVATSCVAMAAEEELAGDLSGERGCVTWRSTDANDSASGPFPCLWGELVSLC